jgi:hypothetical protein
VTALGFLYGAMAVLVAAISVAAWLRKPDRSDCTPLAASLLLMALWALSVAVATIRHAMDMQSILLFLPVIDLIGIGVAIRLHQMRKTVWSLVLAYAFLAQLSLHFVYHALSDQSPLTEWRYKTALDVVYCVQLLTVAFPGVAHGLRHLFRRLVFRGASAVAGGQ